MFSFVAWVDHKFYGKRTELQERERYINTDTYYTVAYRQEQTVTSITFFFPHLELEFLSLFFFLLTFMVSDIFEKIQRAENRQLESSNQETVRWSYQFLLVGLDHVTRVEPERGKVRQDKAKVRRNKDQINDST
jgi:hypothetical protein